MLRPHRNHVLSLFLVVAVTIPLAACGDKTDDSSAATTTTKSVATTTTPTAAAAESVCTARSDVKTAADKAIDEVKSGNFGNAASAFKDVSSSVETLLSSVKDLTSAQQEKVQSQVDDLSNELQSLPSSINNKGDLSASMDKLKKDVDTAIDSIGSDLSC